MEELYLNPNELSPGVILDKKNATFQIYGISCPENAFEYYASVFNWFEKYKKDPLKCTIFNFNFMYFNTSSAKFILIFMNKLGELLDLGYNLKIRWFYSEEDDDMKEEGEDFEDLLDYDIDFEFISTLDENEEEDIDFNSLLN